MSYIVVGNHLDHLTIDKIERGDYVDFDKLIPKDRILAQEDQRMEMVIKGGKTFYIPVSDTTDITNFARWEQAFRVYSNVYTRANPHRSSELIEYNHVIHTIASTHIWENVYMYDKDFRIHLACNPNRSWSIILQQAWSLRLKDHIHGNGHSTPSTSGNNGNNPSGDQQGKEYDPCKRYNRGYCNFGSSCCYEHRCKYCFKLGHPIISCRKLKVDMERASRRKSGSKFGNHSNGHRDTSHHHKEQQHKQ